MPDFNASNYCMIPANLHNTVLDALYLQKKTRNRAKTVLVSLIVICVLGFGCWYTAEKLPQLPAVTPIETETDSTVTQSPGAETESITEIAQNVIVFNNTADVPRQNPPFLWCLRAADFIPYTKDDVFDYYGIRLDDSVLVNNGFLENEKVLQQCGIYSNEEVGIYYDMNEFLYQKDSQTVSVAIAKEMECFWGYATITAVFEMDSEKQMSLVGGIPMLLSHTVLEDTDCLIAEFDDGECNVVITGWDLSEDFFVEIINQMIS